MAALTAVEFFSGIGGFSEACRSYSDINVICSFDQSEQANDVYLTNFGTRPNARNLDSVTEADIPKADLWWLSPPCTPYSRRGKAKDIFDARAKSLLNLIDLLVKLQPQYLLLENVLGFAQSQAHLKLTHRLKELGYSLQQLHVCPTSFGIPMKRPRYFLIARRDNKSIADYKTEFLRPNNQYGKTRLSSYLETSPDANLLLDQKTIERFGDSLNIVDLNDDDAYAICFTSNYWKCLKASGSFVKTDEGIIRRFSDREMLKLFGFSNNFRFPKHIDLKTRLRLLGNSLDVRSVKFALQTLLNS